MWRVAELDEDYIRHMEDILAILHNDYSERAFQFERGGQWIKGKSADTFSHQGPFLVTRDEIPDTSELGIWLKINGAFL
jgi:2,4-didehydro-3-deoxy-L-rhamnonate hydrolase